MYLYINALAWPWPRERPIGASSDPCNLTTLFPLLARVPSSQDSRYAPYDSPRAFSASRERGLPFSPLPLRFPFGIVNPPWISGLPFELTSVDLPPAPQLPRWKLVLPIGWNYTWWFVEERYQKCLLRSTTVGIAHHGCPVIMWQNFKYCSIHTSGGFLTGARSKSTWPPCTTTSAHLRYITLGERWSRLVDFSIRRAGQRNDSEKGMEYMIK